MTAMVRVHIDQECEKAVKHVKHFQTESSYTASRNGLQGYLKALRTFGFIDGSEDSDIMDKFEDETLGFVKNRT